MQHLLGARVICHDVVEELGIRSVPAVVIEGKLASCCEGRGPDVAALKAAGLGSPLS